MKRKRTEEGALDTGLTPLQQEWTTLWTRTLPILASAQSESGGQSWPTCIDRSIARIILDNAVGASGPWTSTVKAPATKHMTEGQLQACIDLSQQVIDGRRDIWELDTQSRAARNLEPIPPPDPNPSNPAQGPLSSPSAPGPATPALGTTSKQRAATSWKPYTLIHRHPHPPSDEPELLPDVQYLIRSSRHLTPFKKRTLLYLTQVPRGRFTTYKAIADAMGNGNGRSVGEVMRTNPLAPTVACHRMVGSGLVVGGWTGNWERDGGFLEEKRRLLMEEGVLVDEEGRVKGEVFVGFGEMGEDL